MKRTFSMTDPEQFRSVSGQDYDRLKESIEYLQRHITATANQIILIGDMIQDIKDSMKSPVAGLATAIPTSTAIN
jgi:hypothetical protein